MNGQQDVKDVLQTLSDKFTRINKETAENGDGISALAAANVNTPAKLANRNLTCRTGKQVFGSPNKNFLLDTRQRESTRQ